MAIDPEVEQKLLALSPEFSTIDPNRLGQLVEMAKFHVSIDIFGAAYSYALALVTAHLVNTVGTSGASGGGASGAVTSEKEGDLARSYASAAVPGVGLSTTQYGLDFLNLKRIYVIGCRSV